MKIRFNIFELLGFIVYWIYTVCYIYGMFNINTFKNDIDKLLFITFPSIILIGITIQYQLYTKHFNIIIKLFTKKFEIKLPL